MHREAPPTRKRIVEAALYLFWLQGYAATGVSDILDRARANSGSFYYFFKTKEALLLAVLETYIQLLMPAVMNPVFSEIRDPVERIFGIMGFYRQNLLATGCTYGCPIGRLALELDPENAPAHALIAQNFTAWREAVEACVLDAGIPQAGDVAAFVLTVMEGAVMQSRAYRSLEPYDACVRQLRLHLNALAHTSSRAHDTKRTKARPSRRTR